MPHKPLDKDSEFIVGENKVMGYVLAILFFVLFAYGVFDAIRRNFKDIDYQSYIFALAIVPAIYSFRKAQSNRVHIRINKKGLFHAGRLVTNWQNFINAYIDQDQKLLIDIRDNFVLVVEFRREGVKGGFRKKIPLTNSQDKSEEEVLAAVKFFWKYYSNDLSR